MKKYIKSICRGAIVVAVLSGTGMTSCTDDIASLNDNPLRLTDDHLDIDYANVGAYLPQMQQSIYYNTSGGNWEFQLQQNLFADVYSGYLCPPTPFREGKNSTNYFFVDWTNWPFNLAYENVMSPWKAVKELTKKIAREFYGTSLILKVAGMHRLTDLYGPIPYSDYGNGTSITKYDSQKDIYTRFFAELDTAINLISAYHKENPTSSTMKKYDLIYNGDFSKWLKWANSLRLRLAIRISNVEPAYAKTQGEKALSNEYGLFTDNGDMAQINQPKLGHPLSTLCYSWQDTKMGANMESILVGYDDPRLPIYFSPATDENVLASGDIYKGIIYGIHITDKNTRVGYSNLGEYYSTENKFSIPWQLMTTSEVYFLKAEAALRGWSNAGSVKENYEKGVTLSMEQWGVSAGDIGKYLSNEDSIPIDYRDTNMPKYNLDATSSITIKWDEAADNEIKLERIITQKWIAMFPEGGEAWSEFRRSGYPKLLPMQVNYSNEIENGKVPQGEFIKRLPYPPDEYANNKEGIKSGISLLGGSDNAGVKLWWHTGSNSF